LRKPIYGYPKKTFGRNKPAGPHGQRGCQEKSLKRLRALGKQEKLPGGTGGVGQSLYNTREGP